MPSIKKLNWLGAVLTAAYVAGSGAALADDTEVFFNTAYRDTSKPNILFVMDTSGSMGDRPASASSGPIKIDIVKTALKNLLDSVTGVNAGLARFTVPGGPILLPVRDIDLPADPVTSATIGDSADDAEEATSGAVTINSADLDIVEESGHAQWAAIRFNNVNVPQGAVVNKAVISLSANEAGSGTVNLRIFGENSDNAAAFTTTANNISSRAKTTAYKDWSITSSWTAGNRYSTIDVSNIVQEVASRTGWCGGNSLVIMIRREGSGTNRRAVYSYDSATPTDSTRHPMLNIQFDGDLPTGAGGCYTAQAVSSGETGADDVAESGSSPYAMTSTSTTSRLRSSGSYKAIGLRFPKLNVPQGATILDSQLTFRNNTGSNWTGAMTASVQAVAADDFTSFPIVNAGLTGTTLPKTAAVTVTLPDWYNNRTVGHTGNLNSVISAVTGRAGWVPGNALALIVKHASGTSERRASTYEGRVPAKLTVRYRSTFSTGSYTVRDELKVATDQLIATGLTPLSDTLLEAGLYYRGDTVEYGDTRQNNANNRISHPTTWTGATHVIPSGCDPVLDPLAAACAGERIDGTATYISPITDTCQSNHIVFLTDGEPTSHNAATQTHYTRMSGGDTCSSTTSGSECFVKLAGHYFSEDQSAGLAGDQNVKSYFIGFDINLPLLNDAAAAGGTESSKVADDADSLAAAFNEIIDSINARNNTFVSAGVTVNQTNRLTNLDQLYFSIFSPDITPRWVGNLKRYRLGHGGELYDVNGALAVESASDQFVETAQSWWSASPDGNVPKAGGAASLLVAERPVYTNLNGTTDATLKLATNKVHESSGGITHALLNVTAGDDAERMRVLKWARGVDVADEDGDGNITEANLVFGDPLHSRPALVNYKDGTSDGMLRVFVGTNRGELHSINPDNGIEQWAFVPTDLLGNYKTLLDNNEATAKVYGLDASIVPYLQDTNRDGLIDKTATGADEEKAILYVGMRRGGSKYYAIDVTDPDNPILKFVIDPSRTGYGNLGQTWSHPVIAKAKIGPDAPVPVMIFGGGYSIVQDDTGAPQDDTVGNAVYIASAENGDLLWSSDELSLGMNKSIPADLAAIDLNSDGLIDHVYAADMGAQIWRFDLKVDGTISGGRLAHLQEAATEASNRRFYGGVDVGAVRRSDGSSFIAVAVGSGFREKPLDDAITDHFYAFRDDGVIENFIERDLSLDDLKDITLLLGDSDPDDAFDSDAIKAIEEEDKYGWYYDFQTAGEKNLTAPVIFDNKVTFTTYVPPGDELINCRGGVGTGRFYVLSMVDGNPIRDHTLDGDRLDNADRYLELPDCPTCGFIPPQYLYTGDADDSASEGECNVTALVGTKPVSPGCPRETVKRVKWRHNR